MLVVHVSVGQWYGRQQASYVTLLNFDKCINFTGATKVSKYPYRTGSILRQDEKATSAWAGKKRARDIQKSRAVFYYETVSGYWCNGCLTCAFKFCSALHYLGEHLTENISELTKRGLVHSSRMINLLFTSYSLIIVLVVVADSQLKLDRVDLREQKRDASDLLGDAENNTAFLKPFSLLT